MCPYTHVGLGSDTECTYAFSQNSESYFSVSVDPSDEACEVDP